MIAAVAGFVAGTPLDEFLAGADSPADDRLQRIGVGLALFGVLTAVGVIAFLASVHRGPRSEVRSLVKLAAGSGCLILLGGVAELAGIARVFDVGWSEALDTQPSSAAMLRLLAGVMVLLGLFDQTVPVDAPAGEAGADGDEATPDLDVRWVPGAASAFGIVGAVLGALSFGFDGHTVSEGSRLVHAATNVVHVLAGGVWAGGVVALLVVVTWRRRSAERRPAGAMVVQFSTIATLSLLVIALAGAAMSLMIVDSASDYVNTEWGRRLIIKVIAVAVAGAIGGYNHWVIVPRLAADAGDPAMTRRVATTLAVEAMVLAFVVIVTALLVTSSTVA
jgi:copper transport protein